MRDGVHIVAKVEGQVLVVLLLYHTLDLTPTGNASDACEILRKLEQKKKERDMKR